MAGKLGEFLLYAVLTTVAAIIHKWVASDPGDSATFLLWFGAVFTPAIWLLVKWAVCRD